MSSQIEIKRKSLVAKGTFERFFSGMDKLMTLEFRVIQKSFFAAFNWANILSFSMSHQVFSQTAAILKQFSTSEDIIAAFPALHHSSSL
jgi:hypothetical protein